MLSVGAIIPLDTVTYLQYITEECSHLAGHFHGVLCPRSPCDSLLMTNQSALPSASTECAVTIRDAFQQGHFTKPQPPRRVRRAVWLLSHNFPLHGDKLTRALHSCASREGRLAQLKCSVAIQK